MTHAFDEAVMTFKTAWAKADSEGKVGHRVEEGIIALLKLGWVLPEKREPSNLVLHAKRELELIGEEPETIEGYLEVIQAFADMGHSGGSASIAIPVINELLQFKNLKPLTDNSEEWFHHGEDAWGEPGGIWQNIRNGEAFSNDGGKTYYLLNEGANRNNPLPIHESEKS